MKIVADDKILLAQSLFGSLGNLVLKSGNTIDHEDLIDANILLTRTVTKVNAELLKHTAVQFVGSATAGHDHLDTRWLEQAQIAWAYAPGANAATVANYVKGCVNYLMKQDLLAPKSQAAVIGVGQVGSQVVDKLKQCGFEVLSNDPPRAKREPGFISTPLSEFYDLDLICLHTPLTKTGPFPTYHLLNEPFLKRLKPGCIILNAGRGAVINNEALLATDQITVCLDVWENEPNINLALLKKAAIATPHIAGYSQAAKLRATLMVYEQALEFFKIPEFHGYAELPIPPEPSDYDPEKDTQVMKQILLSHPDRVAHYFRELRRAYPLR